MAKRHVDEILTVSALKLEQGVQNVRKNHPDARVTKLVVGKHVYWMKQSERHETVKKRLRKGCGTEALRRERANLKELAARGVPVPDVVAFDDDYLVIADCGLTLNDLFLSPDYRGEDGVRAFFEAGRALAKLHGQGLALGRGKAKDFCWDGQTVRFIDLEESPAAFDPQSNGRTNLVNFVFHTFFAAFQLQRDVYAEARAFLRGYAADGSDATRQTLEYASRWARRRWWMAALSIPVGFLRPLGRAPDFKATAPTLILLAYPVPDRPEALATVPQLAEAMPSRQPTKAAR